MGQEPLSFPLHHTMAGISLVDSLRAMPSPQGAKKRKGGEARKVDESDETNAIKLITKSVGLLLAEQRNTSARIGHTLLLPADHELTKGLQAAKEVYNEHQPPREQGKPGVPHPWGAPRHVLLAIFIEVTMVIYSKCEKHEKDAIAIWGERQLKPFIEKLTTVIADCKREQRFELLDPLCPFFRFRLAKNGQGIVELTGGVGRVFSEALRKYDLFTITLADVWGMLLLPYTEFVTSGSGPKGRLERQIQKLQNSK